MNKEDEKEQIKRFHKAMEKIEFGYKIEDEMGVGIPFPFEYFNEQYKKAEDERKARNRRT